MSEKNARESCEAAELDDTALAHLHDRPPVPVLLDRLVEAGQHADAVKLWGQWLPLPQAVWWACLCTWHRARSRRKEADDQALASVLRWLRDPTEENRRACGEAVDRCAPASAAGTIARAAFWSSGSLLPPGLPHTPAPPEVSAQAVAAAVITVAEGEGGQARDAYRLFLQLAHDVQSGTNRWK